MSRFTEGDGFEDDLEEQRFNNRLRAAYQIAAEDPKTGDKCSVGEFCAFKGFSKIDLLRTEGRSYLERLENGDYDRDPLTNLPIGPEESEGWEGATVRAGERAGLPEYVAYSLAWKNDMNWQHVTIVQEVCTNENSRDCSLSVGEYHVRTRVNGLETLPWRHARTRPMTPEDRWLRLRNHIAGKIGATLLDQPFL